ncbi:MAG: hypothetical protein AB7S26_36390 [Sandaracinaceae bacterium]
MVPPLGVLRPSFRLVAAIAVVGSALPGSAVAQAPSSVLYISADGAAEDAAALEVELASRHAQVQHVWAPLVGSPAERADLARSLCRSQGADAAMWLGEESDGSRSVRAVSPDTALVAWAPVPAGSSDPRVLALVAASVFDELRRPAPEVPPLAVTVTIRARDDAPSQAVPEAVGAAPLAEPSSPPPFFVEAAPEPEPGPTRRRRDFYVHVGLTTAIISNGLNLGAGFYPIRNLRLELNARPMYVILSEGFAGALSASGAYVTDDDDGRFEVGGELGGLVVQFPNGCATCGVQEWTAGVIGDVYVGFSWTVLPDTELGFRIAGGAAASPTFFSPAGFLDLFARIMP